MSEKMIDEVFAFVRQVANCETSDQGNIRTARELVKRLESSATDPTSPQTPPVQEAIEALKPFALLAEVAHKDHRDSRPVIFAFDTAVAQRLTVGDLRRAAHAVETLQRCSDETARESVGYQVPVGMKLVYVKRWRTIVPLPATHADEIVEALRPTSDGGVSEALALRLRDAAQTAQNDDLSRPISEKRDRHVIRVEAMLDAAEYLEEISAAASPHSRPHGGCE